MQVVGIRFVWSGYQRFGDWKGPVTRAKVSWRTITCRNILASSPKRSLN